MSFNFFVQAFFCCFLLACTAFNGSELIDTEKFLGCVSKFYAGCIQTRLTDFFTHRFVEGCGEGDSVVFSLVVINLLTGFK